MNTAKTDTQLGTVYDFTEGNFAEKKFFFVLTDANVASSYIDKLTKRPVKVFPNSYSLQLEVSSFDRNAKDKAGKASPRQRIMRMITGESSIWKDEQTKDSEVPKMKEYAIFIDGRKLIDGTETNLIEFMFSDDRNESKPNRDKTVTPVYRLVEVGKELENEIKKDMKITEIKTWCYTGDYDEVAAYARTLNVSLGRDSAEVRFRMRQLAEAKPDQFLAGMNNPNMLRKHYVFVAIDANVLRKDENMNALVWAENNSVLIQAPMGIDPIDFFVDHSNTPAGQEVYAMILKIIKKDKKEEVKKVEQIKTDLGASAPTIKTSGVTSNEIDLFLDAAIAQKAIESYGRSTFAYDRNGADQRKFVGRKALLLALTQEPEFYAKVKAKMN